MQSPDEEREGEEGEQVAEEETIVYKYVPPEAKEWKSLGSEKEILEESVKDMRRRVGGWKYYVNMSIRYTVIFMAVKTTIFS